MVLVRKTSCDLRIREEQAHHRDEQVQLMAAELVTREEVLVA